MMGGWVGGWVEGPQGALYVHALAPVFFLLVVVVVVVEVDPKSERRGQASRPGEEKEGT